MTILHIVAIDDEPLALDWLSALIGRLPEAVLAGATTNAVAGIEMIERCKPDIVIVDIELPELSGFEIVKAVRSRPRPYAIFVTAHLHYAPRAFDENALDYLVKPVTPERLEIALAKARRALAADAALHPPRFRSGVDFLVRSRSELVPVYLDDVIWFEGDRDYVRIHVAGGGSYLHRTTLKALERDCGASGFVRVHKSALVKVEQIEAVTQPAGGAMTITLRSGRHLAVGRAYAPAFRAILQDPG